MYNSLRSEFQIGNSCNQVSLKADEYSPLEKSATNHTRDHQTAQKPILTNCIRGGIREIKSNKVFSELGSKVMRRLPLYPN